MNTHPDDTLLHDFVDGRLTDGDRDAIAFHLLDCQRCQTIVAATEELIETGRSARPQSAAPADLWPLVAATTIHERTVRRHVLRSVRRELTIAAIVLMLLSGAAGALGMRMALRAENGWSTTSATRQVERIAVAPKISIATSERAGGGSTVHAEGMTIGIGGHATMTPTPPPERAVDDGAARMAADFIAQLQAREARAFNGLRDLDIRRSRVGQIEDSLFMTIGRLSALRIAYEADPRNSSLADELKALFDERIALIRAAAAEAERPPR